MFWKQGIGNYHDNHDKHSERVCGVFVFWDSDSREELLRTEVCWTVDFGILLIIDCIQFTYTCHSVLVYYQYIQWFAWLYSIFILFG